MSAGSIVFVSFLMVLHGAAAAAADDCPTWFPDLRCEREARWEGFRKPIVAPYLFEDPFVTTGASLYYIHHDFPDRSALGGGEAHVAALQLRLALTERLGFVATKDGYVWLRPELPLLDDEEGWMNLGAGLKYILWEDRERPLMFSGIARVEIDSGSSDVLQGQGSGVGLFSVSSAWGPGSFSVMGDLGLQLAFSGKQSSSVFYHLYAGYALAKKITPFVQVSGLRWFNDGDGSLPVDLNIGVTLPIETVTSVLGVERFEGADVLNLGSNGVDNLDLITVAGGVHFALTDRLTLSLAYERPVTEPKGIFKQRFTSNLTVEF